MSKYNLSMRIMHWLVSGLIITLLSVGTYMKGLPMSEEKWQIYNMHKSFGLITLAFIVLRVVIRINSKIPAIPVAIPALQANVARFVQFMLYVSILIMPISGYVMAMASGHGINFMNSGHMVINIIAEDLQLASLAQKTHEIVAISLAILLSLHIAGSIKHLLWEKINLFKRMI